MAYIYSLPELNDLITPLLTSLCVAGVSSRPPYALLPLLSPILRQRVQLLSLSSQDSWTSLLCYDDLVASKLKTNLHSPNLELHPVSGQVEIDWDSDSEVQFRRLDRETLEALVTLPTLDLSFKLVWCVNDPDSNDGQDGWRIGEVGTCSINDETWGAKSIVLAEQEFMSKENQKLNAYSQLKLGNPSIITEIVEEKEDDDENYWAQYDNISTQTPAQGLSPAVPKDEFAVAGGDDEYYAGYDIVQPALDNHDPDEALDNASLKYKVTQNPPNLSSLLLDPSIPSLQQNSYEAWTEDSVDSSVFITKKSLPYSVKDSEIVSNGTAVTRPGQQAIVSENAIKTHIGTSLKSLYRLARTAGIGQGEFDRLVRTQLDLLTITNENEDDF